MSGPFLMGPVNSPAQLRYPARQIGYDGGKPIYASVCCQSIAPGVATSQARILARQIGYDGGKPIYSAMCCSTPTTQRMLARQIGYDSGKPIYASLCCPAQTVPGSSSATAPCIVCDQCIDGTPITWTVVLSGFTGADSFLNGTWILTEDSPCSWTGGPRPGVPSINLKVGFGSPFWLLKIIGNDGVTNNQYGLDEASPTFCNATKHLTVTQYDIGSGNTSVDALPGSLCIGPPIPVPDPCDCSVDIPQTLFATVTGATGGNACLNGTYTLKYYKTDPTPCNVFVNQGSPGPGWFGQTNVCSCPNVSGIEFGLYFCTDGFGNCVIAWYCNCNGGTNSTGASLTKTCSPFSVSGTIPANPLGLWSGSGGDGRCHCTISSSLTLNITITP